MGSPGGVPAIQLILYSKERVGNYPALPASILIIPPSFIAPDDNYPVWLASILIIPPSFTGPDGNYRLGGV